MYSLNFKDNDIVFITIDGKKEYYQIVDSKKNIMKRLRTYEYSFPVLNYFVFKDSANVTYKEVNGVAKLGKYKINIYKDKFKDYKNASDKKYVDKWWEEYYDNKNIPTWVKHKLI